MTEINPLSIVIDGKEFTIISKSAWKRGTDMYLIKGLVGNFNTYGSISDGNVMKLFLTGPVGILKRSDSYVYGHNIHYQLATFILKNRDIIPKVPSNNLNVKSFQLAMMEQNALTIGYITAFYTQHEIELLDLSQIFSKFASTNVYKTNCKRHVLFDILYNNVPTTSVDVIEKVESDVNLELLYGAISRILELFGTIENKYERYGMICSFYVNLFTTDITQEGIECIQVGRNEIDMSMVDKKSGDEVKIKCHPYEFCTYKLYFKSPTVEHINLVCSKYGIDPILFQSNILDVPIFNVLDIPPVYVITQSYTYVINNVKTGEISSNMDSIEIPHVVLYDLEIGDLGTYSNFILCGGYVNKIQEYNQQLLSPVEYQDRQYSFILPYITKTWNPITK